MLEADAGRRRTVAGSFGSGLALYDTRKWGRRQDKSGFVFRFSFLVFLGCGWQAVKAGRGMGCECRVCCFMCISCERGSRLTIEQAIPTTPHHTHANALLFLPWVSVSGVYLFWTQQCSLERLTLI